MIHNYSQINSAAEIPSAKLSPFTQKAGEKKSRVLIENQFKVAGRVIKESGNNLSDALVRFFGTKFGYYVEVKGKNDEVLLLNISSLCKRALLSEDAVKQAVATNSLAETISGQQTLIRSYSKLFDSFFTERSHTFEKKGTTHSDFTPKVLMKIVELTLQSKEGSIRFHIGTNPKDKNNIPRRTFITWADREGNVVIKEQKLLGEGSFGKAKRWTNVADGTSEVFKQARRNFPELVNLKKTADENKQIQESKRDRAITDIANERKVLQHVHGEGKVLGVEPAPTEVISVSAPVYEVGDEEDVYKTKESQTKTGIMKTEFDGDLFNRIVSGKITDTDKYVFGLQLLAGGQALNEHNILHGDIKPENIFMQGKRLYIADFGGARIADEVDDIKKLFQGSGTCTAAYLCKTDIEVGFKLLEELEKIPIEDTDKRKEIQERLTALSKKGDSFAAGTVLYSIFTGGAAFDKITEIGVDPKSFVGFNHPGMKVPKHVQKIIKGLIRGDDTKRYSPAKGFSLLQKYVNDNKPEALTAYSKLAEGYTVPEIKQLRRIRR
ncbi:MAG: hypothetical protein K2X39_07300 [Silvanigrellaceae bacterium]|nr:hypothetical protein [Silvanigrellaceae bacterium]